MSEQKQYYRLTIDNRQGNAAKEAFDRNAETFIAKNPDGLIEVRSKEGQLGTVKLKNYNRALELGYTPVMEDEDRQIIETAPAEPSGEAKESTVAETPGAAPSTKFATDSMFNQGFDAMPQAKDMMSEQAKQAQQQINNLAIPQVPKIPGQSNLEYAETVTAAANKVAQQEQQRLIEREKAEALPRTRDEINKQISEIDSRLNQLSPELDPYTPQALESGASAMMTLINLRKKKELTPEESMEKQDLQQKRKALELQAYFLGKFQKYEEYDKKGDRSGMSNFFRGMYVGGDMQALATFGLSQMDKDMKFLSILEKGKRDISSLTLDEKKALQMYTNLQQIASKDRGAAFSAGTGMQQTFEFMRDMALMGFGVGSGAKALAQQGVKQAVKQAGKSFAKATMQSFLKAPLTPSFYSNLTRKFVENNKVSNYATEHGPLGSYNFDIKQLKPTERIAYEAYAETASEFATESLGSALESIGMLRRLAKSWGKGSGIVAKGLQYFDQIHRKTMHNTTGKFILNGMRQMGLNNFPMEMIEEIANVPMQAALLGDKQQLKQLQDPRFYQEVAIATAALGGVHSAVNLTVGGVTAGIERKKIKDSIQSLRSDLEILVSDNPNLDIQAGYAGLLSTLDARDFYDNNDELDCSKLLNKLEGVRRSAGADSEIAKKSEQLVKQFIYREGQTEALRALAEDEIGQIEYGASGSVVSIIDSEDKELFVIGETDGTALVSNPLTKEVFTISKKDIKQAGQPVSLEDFLSSWIATKKPGDIELEDIDDVQQAVRQTDNMQQSQQINKGDNAVYGGVNVRVLDIYYDELSDQTVATIIDDNEQTNIVPLSDISKAVPIDNKDRYIFPSGKRGVIRQITSNGIVMDVLDDNNQVIDHIILSGTEELAKLQKVPSQAADIVEQAVQSDSIIDGETDRQKETGTTQTGNISQSDNGASDNMQQPQQDNLPRDKSGEIDYDALFDQDTELFAREYAKIMGEEETVNQLSELANRLDKQIRQKQNASKMQTSFNRKIKLNKEIADMQKRRDAVTRQLLRMTQSQQQPAQQNAAPAAAADNLIKDKWESSRKEIGSQDTRTLPDGTQLKGRWVIAEATAPTPSHDPHTLQSSPSGQRTDGILKEPQQENEIKPIGVGPFGNIYNQFKGKAKEAIAFLSQKKGGEAIGALHHKQIGDIDLVWGKEGTGKSDGYGLAKLIKYHPEVLDNLQEILDDMDIVSRSDNRIQLESQTHQAAVRLTWNEEKKNWLLTAFEKKNSAFDNTTDTDETHSSKRNDTATPQNTVSDSKANELSSEKQTVSSPDSSQTIYEKAQNSVLNREISAQAAKTETSPTEKQKLAGNYRMGHVKVLGLDISIENPAGSTRSGVDQDGKPWSITMNNHYGYIKGTRGKDKDHIDVFLGNNIVTGKVYVVDQVNPDGSFDEHKVMLGFDSAQQAAAVYLSNYEPGWQGLGNITEVPIEQFKAWLGSNTAKTKPFREYRNQSIEQVKQSVEQYSKKYGVPVEVVESSQQVQTPTARAAIRRVEQTGRGEVFGWFEPTTGKVQIYAPSVAFSLNELEKTILHEVVAHKGLRALLGEEKFNALCDEVFDNMDDNVKLIYGAYVLGKPVNSLTQTDRVAILNNKSLQREIADELMASFAERGVNEHPSLWEKVKQLVREALKAIGVNINLADADIAYLLYRSSKALQQNTILESAKNIQQTRQVEANLSDKDTARQMGFETRLRSIGGNSGYVGYSMSKRAMRAKEDGRYPKSEFKKEYGVSAAALDIMVEADIINNKEWHHTSKFGNKTTFYGWADDVYEDVYRENKKEIDKICRNVVKLKPETENSSPEKLRQYVSAKKELISKLKDMFADAADKAKRIAAEKYKKEMDNLHAYGEYREANQVPVPERYIASNGVEVDTQQSRFMSDWTAYNNGERLTKRYGKKLRDEAFYELNNNIRANDQNILPFEQWLSQEEQQVRFRTVSQINDKFNEDLQRQIDGTLPAGYVYQLGMPSDVLLSAGLPYLPIELASNRLADKSMQENHPFDLSELTGLVDAIHNPLAVFRSATHWGSYVVLTEIQHKGKNYVVAIKTNKNKGRIRINDIRSVYPKNNNQIVNWINEGLLEYADKRRMPEWISKQQSNSAEVRNLFRHTAKIVNDFENPNILREDYVRENARFRRVYHGSRASFNRFDNSHMGEGEGAQAYGWGSYVSEVEGIGRAYAVARRDEAISKKHQENAIINKLAREILSSNNV